MKYTVSDPYHGESRSIWYVLDDEGDPVESCDNRPDAMERAKFLTMDTEGVREPWPSWCMAKW